MPLGRKMNNPNDFKSYNTTNPQPQQNTIVFTSENPRFTFSDLILHPDTYNAIQDAIAIFTNREIVFNKWGLWKTHRNENKAGINLYGAPGTGKTMAAHAISAALGRKILTVDYSVIESKYVGDTSKNLTAMFMTAKKEQSIIFFDEADALLSKRVTNMSSSTDVSLNQTRSQLLLLINGFNDVILFATNFISNYDPAFMRRINAHIKFELPDYENRVRLWQMYIPSELPTDADIRRLAQDFEGTSGAEISNAVLSAALKGARLNKDIVPHNYFADAINNILQSKAANAGNEVISKRTVSAEYVKEQLGGLPEC